MNKPTDKHWIFIIYLFLTVVSFILFLQIYKFDFVYFDDPEYVSGNLHILTGFIRENIIWAFTAGYASNWHPLTWLSHMLDCWLFGPSPHWHHITNLLLHIANTLLLFTAFRQMTGTIWRSAFVATLFAVHPLHVESVAWISERKDVLSTFFWILTMIFYARYVNHPNVWRYLLTLFIFALGLMAKPMLVTLPFVLFLLDYWPLQRFEPGKNIVPFKGKSLFSLILEKVPFFVLSTVSSIITLAVQKAAVVTVGSLPLSIRIENSLVAYVRYIVKMFWPSRLACYYPHPEDSLSHLQVAGTALLLLATSILIIRFSRRHKYLLSGWLWYIGTLVPVIGLVQVGEQAMADRYTYVPLTGLFIIIAWGISDLLAKWKYRRFALSFATLFVLLILSICTYFQTSYWHDTITLFERAVDVTNDNYVVHHFFAQYLYKQGQIDKAIYHDSQALQIEPDFPQAHNNLGSALVQKGRLSEAIIHFKRAVQVKPNFTEAYCNAGGALSDLGRFDEAIEFLSKALLLNPNLVEAHYNLGIIFAKQDKLDKAIEHLTAALRLNPGLAKAHSNLGVVLAKQGKFDEAVFHFKESLRLDPNNAESRRNLDTLLSRPNTPK